MTKKSLTALLLLTVLAACNTVAGAGQDVTNTGRAVTGSAERSGASR